MTRRISAAAAASAVAAALAAGCLSIPPYQPKNGVTRSEDATGTRVTGPGFALHFAGGDGFHFPDALTIDGHDVMGHESSPACFGQDGTGVLIYPTPRISPTGTAPAVRNQLTAVLTGPAVVKMQLDWTTQLACSRGRAPGGTSTFTVFPDGRILRNETFDDPKPDDNVTANGCACNDSGKNQGFTVSSYWTFARAAFQDQFYYTDQLTLPLPAATDSDVTNFDPVCLDGGDYQIASTWITGLPGDTTAIRGGIAVFGHLMVKEIGASRLDIPWTTSSTLTIDHDGCQTAFRRANRYAHPPMLKVNGQDTAAASRDGIYGGDADGSGLHGITLATDHVELTADKAVPTGFAVALRFPRSITTVRATLAGATGEWYVPQRVTSTTWIVWFPAPLEPGQTIAIEPAT